MRAIYIILIIVILLGLLVGAYFIFLYKSPLEKAMAKTDPVTGKNAKELIESFDIEGIERAGLTQEDIKLIMESGEVDMSKSEAAVEQEVKETIEKGEEEIEKKIEEWGRD